MAGSPWKKRTWKNYGTSEEVQKFSKSVRSLGSLKASEFPFQMSLRDPWQNPIHCRDPMQRGRGGGGAEGRFKEDV